MSHPRIQAERDKYPVKLAITDKAAGEIRAMCWTIQELFPGSEITTIARELNAALTDAGAWSENVFLSTDKDPYYRGA